MEAINIGSRREVCWDEALIDRADGIRVEMHRPEFRNVAFECDAPWEGNVSGYCTIINDNTFQRLYYHGSRIELDADGKPRLTHKSLFCYAQSQDGKHFERVPLHLHNFWGTTDNNIVFTNIRDNISFFKDTNPDCPPDALYKGLAEENEVLCLYKSADGVHFERVGVLADDGAYDSLNVGFWDETRGKYFLYYRGIHGANAKDGKWTHEEDHAMHTTIIRDIRVRTSVDFVHWDAPKMLDYGPEADDLELYINNVRPYDRAKHMFIGFPMRYLDRYMERSNFKYLPDRDTREQLVRRWGRSGTVMTDTVLMTSRDGYHFRRSEEAFLTPGPENGTNWYYGSTQTAYGLCETKADRPGAPNEISIYMIDGYRTRPAQLCRYAVRLDGFFSWRCGYKPGELVTKPLVFEGDRLSINFSTSALGYLRIRLLGADGSPIEGYDSGRLFGDSVARNVDFDRPLAALAGKEIRMQLEMSDADLYSFRFEKNCF